MISLYTIVEALLPGDDKPRYADSSVPSDATPAPGTASGESPGWNHCDLLAAAVISAGE